MKKDEKLITTGSVTHNLLNLSQFPNFHKTGSIEGMRNLYYGRDALLVKSGDYIYHVDEKTFQAVKDSDFILSKPRWMIHVMDGLTRDEIQKNYQDVVKPKVRNLEAEREKRFRGLCDGFGLQSYSLDEIKAIADGHKLNDDPLTKQAAQAVMSQKENNDEIFKERFREVFHEEKTDKLRIQADMLQKIQQHIQDSVTDYYAVGADAEGRWQVKCRIDGVQQRAVTLTASESQQLYQTEVDERNEPLMLMVAKYHSEKLLVSFVEKSKQQQNMTASQPQETIDVQDMAEKMSAVFEKFYSLHEVDELCRVITDPEKSVDDVKALMSDIAQRNRIAEEREATEARITAATFLYPSVTNVALSIQVDGLNMPIRLLNPNDAQMIRGTDMSKLSESDVQEMARDLAITYYDDVLRATPEQLSKIANAETKSLTESDARTYTDFDNAVANKFPNGATLQIPDLINDDIWGYIIFDLFRDESFISTPIGEEPAYTETLKSEVRIPENELHRLMASANVYNDTVYTDFIESLPNAEDYEAPVTEMLHKHPDLNGAQLEIPQALVSKHIYIEGQPLDAVVSIMLQKNEISDEQLKAVLTDPTAHEAFVAEITNNRSDELKFIKNPEFMYFYEPGVLGHARVDRMRGVTFSGEPLSRASQDRIMDFAQNRNIAATNGRGAFFLMPGAESKLSLYLDTMKNQLHKIYSQLDWQGNTFYTEGSNQVSEKNVMSMQDITGRISDAQIIGNNNPMVRCKIDGVQQSGQKLTRADISTMVHFMDKPEDFNSFALSMAAKHFATELYESVEQKQNKGMGR